MTILGYILAAAIGFAIAALLFLWWISTFRIL